MSDVHDSHPSPDRLQAFLDGEVPSRERRRVEAHVASCVRCAEELAMWRGLFEDLEGLRTHRPTGGFHARVMSGVRLPIGLPLAARVRDTLGSLRPHARPRHLGAGVLQDLADGALTARPSARALTHLDGCATCTKELRGWTAVVARISELDRFAPGADFADTVMAGIAPAAARAPVRRPGLARALTGVRRVLPQTRRAWAAIAGAAVTPAVTFGLVLYTVFSHPTLTPGALASFTFWQLSDLLFSAWSTGLSGGLVVARSVGLDGFVEAMVAAPLVAAGGVAVRVLYKNLIVRRSIRPRYASASAS
jgi:anti-sigma factor ChrR (cupin superfamily)